MRKLLFLLFLAIPAFSQCTLTTFVAGTTIQPAPVNANFTSLNTCKTNRYSGSTVPGSIASSRLGDLYTRTGTTEAYMCFAAGPCTAVASGNWVLLGTGSTSGTVTVVGAGNLTSTALMTGGGAQTAQTPCATCTLDASGNFSTPGSITTGAGTTDPGVFAPLPGTVASLPVCNAGIAGGRASVTDANSTTFLATLVGGGSNKVPVFCTGTTWVVG